MGRPFEKTRLSRIPDGVLPSELVITLDLTISGVRLQIRRSLASPNQPVLVDADGSARTFSRLDEMNGYLGELLFNGKKNAGQVSFRSIMSLLIRDERSGFKSCVNPFDPASKAPDDITPHLFLLGIDATAYSRLINTIKRLDDSSRVLKDLKAAVTNNNELKLSDIPARLNEERQATKKLDEALTELKADPAFESVEGALNEIEGKLRLLRGERKKLSFQVDQIRSIPISERIDADDIRIVYDRIKAGLGDLGEKSLEQATLFKVEIEKFQQTLWQEELTALEAQRSELVAMIQDLTSRHAELTRQVDRHGILQELRTGLEVATRRSDEYHRLNSQFIQYEARKKEVEVIKAERGNDLIRVNEMLSEYEQLIQSFNDTVVGLHETIQQTSHASFRFSVRSKRPLTFDLRIQDDGSHSIDQVRVFIYDFALMLDQYSKHNHPHFFVHDNILEVDQDTLTRCLNFLNTMIDHEDEFQYILTLNSDRVMGEFAEDVELQIEDVKRASFTKQQQFPGIRYQEISNSDARRRSAKFDD